MLPVEGFERVLLALVVLLVAAASFYVMGRRDLAEKVMTFAVVVALAYAFNVPIALQISW